MEEKVIVILGSGRDEEFSNVICTSLKRLGVKYERRIASAHKTPQKLLTILSEYDRSSSKIVYITVAGRSNALSGLVDANTIFPVIACSPYSESFSGSDIYSSLRMPSGVAPMVVLEPENAAIAATKILALNNPELISRILKRRQELVELITKDDERIRGG